MTWDDYYEKFYDWAESTRISKLSSVDALGPADEVAEVMLEFAFNHEDIVNRIARKAIEQKLIFSAENILDLTNCMDSGLQGQMALQSVSAFLEEDIQKLEGYLDDDIIIKLYRTRGFAIPEIFKNDEPEADRSFAHKEKEPSGFFSALALAFAAGHGFKKGIEDSTRKGREGNDL